MANKPIDTRPSVSPELSDTEKADAARQAVPAQAVTAVPPVATEPVPPVAPVAPVSSHSIVFTERTGGNKKGTMRYLADGAIRGCFGPYPIESVGYMLALENREIRVFLPGPFQASGTNRGRDIRPAMIPLERPTLNPDGTKNTHEADLKGVLAIAKLEQAIRDSWVAAQASKQPFGVPFALTL